MEAIGDQLPEIIDNISSSPIKTHGNPPFLLADGDAPMLWVDDMGRFKRLQPAFSITSDISEVPEETIIYTLPVASFGLVRFVPAIQDYEPEATTETNFYPDEYEENFLEGLSNYLNVLTSSIPTYASLSMSKSLLTYYGVMQRLSASEETELQSLLKQKEVRDLYVRYLTEALAEGAQKAGEAAIAARSKM